MLLFKHFEGIFDNKKCSAFLLHLNDICHGYFFVTYIFDTCSVLCTNCIHLLIFKLYFVVHWKENFFHLKINNYSFVIFIYYIVVITKTTQGKYNLTVFQVNGKFNAVYTLHDIFSFFDSSS